MRGGREIVMGFRNRWRFLLYLEGVIYAAGVGFFLGSIFGDPVPAILGVLLTMGAVLWFRKPWTRDLGRAAAYIDEKVLQARYSSSLLLSEEASLAGLPRLQRHRVAREIEDPVRRLVPPNGLLRAVVLTLMLFIVAVLVNRQGWLLYSGMPGPGADTEQIGFTPLDSLQEDISPLPRLQQERIRIDYPAYSAKRAEETTDPNLRALVGSYITWDLRFDGPVDDVWLEIGGKSSALKQEGSSFRIRRKVETSAFYNFRFSDTLGRVQVSQLYALQALEDKAPEIELSGIPQYSYFEPGETGLLELKARISDDYGLGDAYIIATVSKGSGEAVKFREERLPFRVPLVRGRKNAELDRSIDLGALGMESGDELYFYVEALDLKTPKPNRGRSETFFAVIRDTVSVEYAVEGNLGVDRMPDYFRSQRQLIIDTEKLIEDAPKLFKYDFMSRSNELGFDQKALRIKYGQFMGEEQEYAGPGEMAAASGDSDGHDHGEEGHDHDHEGHDHSAEGSGEEGSIEDLLSEYTHDHDGHNEHNLVEDPESAEEDPLHEYMHDHGDPEAATLFEESLRTKLRKALNVMWDAELQLRLNKPKASLPYQYRALRLIQDIKNSARIYVHRIGYDPPPIKEDKRLSGDISELENTVRQASVDYQGAYPSMRQAIARLEVLISGREVYSSEDQVLFQRAGEELAGLALETPGRYLKALRYLRATETLEGRTPERLMILRTALLIALPEAESLPARSEGINDELNTLFLQEVSSND